MEFEISLAGIVETVVGGTMTVAGKIMLNRLGEMSRDIKSANEHLAKINGSIGAMKVWQQQHEKQDDERHRELIRQLPGRGLNGNN